MQDRYVGDIGDFAKYGLLRALSAGRKLGVAWYLYPDDNNHGSLIQYLDAPEVWRPLDPDLFDALKGIIIRDWKDCSDFRTVADIERYGLLPGAIFANECLDKDLAPNSRIRRGEWRTDWFERVRTTLVGCELVFADPDNGLYPDEKYNASDHEHWKRLPLAEARQLAKGRPAIFYHHNARRDHQAEIRCWMEKLCNCAYALYWRRYCNRTFFIVNPDQPMIDGLAEFIGNLWQAELRLGIKPDKLSELITPQG